MEWLFHVLFLTFCMSLVSLPVNGEGIVCQIQAASTKMNMEGNSAAYYFSQSEASDDWAIKSLQAELGRVLEFKNIWDEATTSWKQKNLPVPDGLREEHVIALTACTIGGDWYGSFNDEVRSYGGDLNTYNACFNLKSFHYLLSVALEVLRNSSIGRLVYRGTKSQISGTLGTEMRFGIFASTFFNKKVAEEFRKGTVFVISPSYGVDLQRFSDNQWQEKVLIPPYEKFNITKSPEGNRYTLVSTGYKAVMVELLSDGSGLKVVSGTTSTKITCWVWVLTALGTSVFLWV